MLYQKQLGGEHPYFVQTLSRITFCEHRHPDAELCFCMEGSCRMRIGGASYTLHKGDLAVVGSMVAHAYDTYDGDSFFLNLMVGPAFFGEFFDLFARSGTKPPILSLHKDDPSDAPLVALLEETARLHCDGEIFSELQIKGNLYKICAHILKNFPSDEQSARELRGVLSIERALAVIRTRYAEPLKLGDVAAENGYRESNFCKVFKTVTGETFHAALNRHRVEVACMHLSDSDDALEEIALEVGFADAKSFCRVFKALTGVTPNTYRKNTRR